MTDNGSNPSFQEKPTKTHDQGAAPPWRQPSELDDLFLYHLARLMSSAGTMVVRLREGGFGITRREWRMIGLLAT